MAKEFAKRFYNSKAWAVCRDSYIESVHGLCERCLKAGRIEPGYIVHHKIELSTRNIDDPMVALNHEHLEYLCMTCHNKEHFRSSDALAEGLAFDEDGELIRVTGVPPTRF